MRFVDFVVPLLVIVTRLDEAFGYATGWFNYRLLINPGLSPAVAASTPNDCVNLCVAAGNCSAASYMPSTQQCVLSRCAILHMVKNTGWHSYVLFSFPVESIDYSAPMFEWMLTDSCTLRSTGSVPGVPDMNFTVAASYQTSPSNYIGKAASLVYNDGNYLYTGQSSVFNVSYFTNGFTISGWFYQNSVQNGAFLEFGYWSGASWVFGTHFWYNSNMYYHLMDSPDYVDGKPYSQPLNVWTHYAMTFNPSTKSILFYANGSSILCLTYGGSNPTSHVTSWTTVVVAKRPGANGLDGKYYCIKFHLSALTAADIQANSQACNGRIRIS